MRGIKGLLIKECVNMRMYARTMVILTVFFLAMGLVQQNLVALIAMLSCAGVMLTMMNGVNSVSFDAASKWDCYALSMPVRRRDVVLSKYLFSMGTGVAYTLLELVVVGVMRLFIGEYGWTAILATLAGTFCVGILLLSVVLPLLYRFGVEKARFIILAVALVPSFGGILIGRLVPQLSLEWLGGLNWGAVAAATPVAVLVLAVASYLLSVRIFERKEL